MSGQIPTLKEFPDTADSGGSPSAVIEQWRERALHRTLRAALVLGGLFVYLPSVVFVLGRGKTVLAVVDTLILVWAWILYRRRDWPFAVRAAGLIAPGMLFGAFLLITLGPFSSGFVFLASYTVIAAAVTRPRAMLAVFAVLVLILAGIGTALGAGLLPWSHDPAADARHWVVLSANVIFVTGTVAYALGFLLRSLEEQVRNAHGMSEALVREHAAVLEVNRQLEDAFAERRRLEADRQRLATAVGKAATLIVILDANWRVEYVNPAFERVTGWRRDLVTGRPIDVVGGLGDDGDTRAAIVAAVTEGSSWSGRLRNRRHDGLTYDAEAAIAPLRDDEGRVAGCVAVLRDISREAALEAQLRQSQKLEAIGTLAGGIAHDFNNLLVPILGCTHAVRERLADGDEAHALLGDVITAAERARDLVSQILAFSRKTEPRREPRPVAPIIREAGRLLRATLPAGIRIEERIHEDGSVSADPTEIHQIVMNLATNAYHSMRRSGGILTLSSETLPPEKLPAGALVRPAPRYTMITVGDTGIGMDARTLERLFDPFFTTKQAGEGTGLGLAMVHGTVTALGGAIDVRSWPGAGTIVRIFLPDPGRPAAPAPAATPSGRGAGRHILLVDDEATVRRVAQRMLERAGFQVTAVESGTEALRRVRAAPRTFDAVMTDLNMPAMTGVELARALHSLHRDLPIVLASGYVETDSLPSAEESGIVRIVHKPFSPSDISAAVTDALEKRDLLAGAV